MWANLYSIMSDTRYFKDPDQFKPERFIGADGKVHRPEALIPFSIGKRACPGEHLARNEVHLLTACIFQRYSVEPPPGVTLEAELMDIVVGSFPKPYKLVVKPRI